MPAAFDTTRPCPRKVRRPPSPAALAEAEHGHTGHHPLDDDAHVGAAAERVAVVDLAIWARATRDRQVAP